MGRFFWFLKLTFFLSFFFVFASPCQGMSFTLEGIKGYPSVISSNQEIELIFSFNDVCKEVVYYLEAGFKAKEGTRYFGWTQNEKGDWHRYSEDNFKNFYQIELKEGTNSASLIAKPDSESNYFNGSGDYILKLFRFTEGGSKTSSDNFLEVFIEVPTPSPPVDPTPIPTSAIYKINEAKDKDGVTLSAVKIYVDGVYIHHYAPETLTFCGDCKCNGYVDCGFGEHTITLKKSDYEDWSDTEMINEDGSYEVDPVMTLLFLTPTPTPTSTPTPTPTPTQTPVPTATPSSGSDSVLGLSSQPSASSANTATDSGYLADFMCPFIEELETKFQTQEDNNLGQNAGDEEKKDINETRPHPRYVLFLGMAAVVGSLGSFLKETGFLVKWLKSG